MTKGSPEKPAAVWTQRQGTASPGLLRVRQKARQEMAEPFTALLHHVTPALLEASYYALKRNAAPGVDGITWEAYGSDLETNVTDRLIRATHDRPNGATFTRGFTASNGVD